MKNAIYGLKFLVMSLLLSGWSQNLKADSCEFTFKGIEGGVIITGLSPESSLRDVSIPTSITVVYNDGTARTYPVVGVQWNFGSEFTRNTYITSFSMPSWMKFYYYDYDESKWKPHDGFSFSGFYDLTSVNLPSTITRIGGDPYGIQDGGFGGCYSLKSFDVPNTIKIICPWAFINSGLTSITIPNSVDSIGVSAFERCSSLTSIDLPNSVTFISHLMFADCTGLTSVTIPNSVTSIGVSAFQGCSSLTSVTIPNSVTSIGVRAFQGCSSLTSIDLPNSVTYISEDMFENCTGLTSVTIPNSVTNIDSDAFSGCTSLLSVSIGNSVTQIGNLAFRNCPNLKTVYWNARNYTGEGMCFKYCRIRNIIIGSETESIGNDVFWYYDRDSVSVETVTCYAVTPPIIINSVSVFTPRTYSNALLEVPRESLEAYKNAPGWKNFFQIVAIEDETVTGDADGDGQVTIDDVVVLIDYLLSGDASLGDVANADCNGDGQVTIDDVVALIDYLLSGTW